MISVQYCECYCTLLKGALFSGHSVLVFYCTWNSTCIEHSITDFFLYRALEAACVCCIHLSKFIIITLHYITHWLYDYSTNAKLVCVLSHVKFAVSFFSTRTDTSATVTPISVKFCMMVHIGPGHCFSPLWGSTPKGSPKSKILALYESEYLENSKL